MTDWVEPYFEPDFFKRHPHRLRQVWETQDGEYITVGSSLPSGRLYLLEYRKYVGREIDFDELKKTHSAREIMIRPDYMHCDEGDEMEYAKPGGVKALIWEERTDGEKKYTVRYYNPIMGVYETHWDTQEEAEKEAAYDHGMNGAPTRVLDPDGNEIATFEEGQRHD